MHLESRRNWLRTTERKPSGLHYVHILPTNTHGVQSSDNIWDNVGKPSRENPYSSEATFYGTYNVRIGNEMCACVFASAKRLTPG